MPESPPASVARFSLAGRTALVTGASRGIGAAIAGGLKEAGAAVFGLSRSGTAPADIAPLACDLADRAAIVGAFGEIERRTGRLDILVNAAGIALPGRSASLDDEIARFEGTLAIDLVAPFVCSLAAAALMRRHGRGAIVNVTSINAVRGFPRNPGYVAAKAGLAGLTRALALDLAADGIRVNALAPSYIRTAMTEQSFIDPIRNEERRRHTLLGRWGNPDDVVGAAVFLASDASAYMTGQELFVDGGWTVNGLISSGERAR